MGNHRATRETRVMITSGGGPGVWGLLAALRHLPNRDTTLVVSDPDTNLTLGTALADIRVRLPLAADPAYVDCLLETCRHQAVDVLIPVYDGELLAVTRRRAEFNAVGTRVLLPPTDVVAACLDKRAMATALRDTDFLPQSTCATTPDELAQAFDDLGYPRRMLCIKPTTLAGGRGFHIIDAAGESFIDRVTAKPGARRCTAEEFLNLRRQGPERFPLIVAEYCPGEELGIDLLAEDGRPIEMVVRRKGGAMLHGNPSRIVFAEQPGEREWTTRLAREMNLSGLVIIDARYDLAGQLRLLEVNPRPGAYIGMTCARVHLLAWAIDRLLGEEVEPHEYAGNPGLNLGLRVFADMLIGENECMVLPAAGQAIEENSDACCVPRGTSG
ncbi:MAG: ATP-grasp domain-containing protein [Phycisphaerae bacterium]|nr:ATP-grasp domain-containing protein [Phycisphaerae bacterium]